MQLRVKTDLTSQSARAGEAVLFVVAAPVQAGGITIIATGAEARGTVVHSVSAAHGQPGALVVAVDSAQAADGSWVPLRATARAVDSADLILPAQVFTFGGGASPATRETLLSATRKLECWVDEARTFVVTPPDRPGAPATVASAGETPPRTDARCTLVRLPVGTAVRVHPLKEVSARRVKAGDRVDFAVSAAVEASGNVLFREGAVARGLVLWARPLGVAGTRSELVVMVDRVEASDGTGIAVAPSPAGPGNGELPSGRLPIAAVVATDREASLGIDRTCDLVVCEERLFAVGAKGRQGSGPQVRALAMPSDALSVAPAVAALRPPVLEAFQVGRDVAPSGDPRGVSNAFSGVSRLLAWISVEPLPLERQLEVSWFRDGVPYAASGLLALKAGDARAWTALEASSGGLLPPGRWVVVLSWRGQVLDLQSFTVGR